VTYLGKDAAGNFRYEYAVNVNWEGATSHEWINLYYSLEGGVWGFFFLFNVGTGQIGSDAVEFPIGSHFPGAHITFLASVPGITDSNQVSIIVGEGIPPPTPEGEEAPPISLWKVGAVVATIIVGAGIGLVVVRRKK